MTKSSTTPIVMLTLQDLRDVIREEMGSSVNVTHENVTENYFVAMHMLLPFTSRDLILLGFICHFFFICRNNTL